MNERRQDAHEGCLEEVEELEEDIAEHNPDPVTRRESLEQELMEEGRSEEGKEIELEDDVSEHHAPGSRGHDR